MSPMTSAIVPLEVVPSTTRMAMVESGDGDRVNDQSGGEHVGEPRQAS
jgi:hypothetical protein